MLLLKSRLPCLFLTLALVVLAGCGGPSRPHAAARKTQRSNLAPRTVIVPDRSDALSAAIAQILSRHGWRLINYSADMTRGRDDYALMASRARYRLTLQDDPVGACAHGGPGFRYRLALIENATGRVPVAMAGVDCLDTIRQTFVRELDGDGI